MLAERIRAVGLVAIALVSLAVALVWFATPGPVAHVQVAEVRVAMAEPIDDGVREVQFVATPAKPRTYFCRYPTSKLKGIHGGSVASQP
jgi:hypothetical protein